MLSPRTFHLLRIVPAALLALLLSLFSLASASSAYGQATFTMTIPGLNHPSIDPTESATGSITLTPVGGFNSPVSLSCQITSGPATDPSPPQCLTNIAPVVPPGVAALTINTTNQTASGLYSFLITGTGGGITQTASVSLTVQPLSEDYTLSVAPTTATPGSIQAGAVATTTITVSPIGTYANNNPPHVITFSCLSIAPPVTLAPVCSFSPAAVTVSPTTSLSSTLTITTTGPTPTTRLWNHRIFFAFWLAIPALGLVGLTTTGTRRKSFLGAFLLTILAASIVVLPACGSTTTLGTNGDTPAGTYTFTITGADESGAPPSNTSTTTVTLTVTKPT